MRLLFIAFVSVVACSSLAAQPVDLRKIESTPECDDLPDLSEINGCINDLVRREDAELNRIYRRAMAAAREIARDNAHSDQQPSALRDAQRAWITFRDADCGAIDVFRVGANLNMEAELCVLAKTRVRIAELRAYYGG